jgi:hypothetical protein
MKRYLIYCPADQIKSLKVLLQDHNIHFNSDWVYDPAATHLWIWRQEIEIWVDEIDLLWITLAIPEISVR